MKSVKIPYVFDKETKNYKRFVPVEATVPDGCILGPIYLPPVQESQNLTVELTYGPA